MELLDLGSTNRVVGATDSNHASSRSHAIMELSIVKRLKNFPEETTRGKLTMIDLAGSERLTKANDHKKQCLKIEGAAISKSLLALGNCIAGLVKIQSL